MGQILNCPVCGARFRATRECSRCGADLAPLMRLAQAAWQQRQAARQSLAQGNLERAAELAAAAQALQDSAAGRRLALLTAWLVRHGTCKQGW
jgi:hypothetical protein